MSTTTPSVQPPYRSIGPLEWLRKNLFDTWYNSILTIVLGWLVIRGLWGAVDMGGDRGQLAAGDGKSGSVHGRPISRRTTVANQFVIGHRFVSSWHQLGYLG